MSNASYDFRIDWNNDGDFDDTGEDVTSRVLARESVTISYGRDQERALSPMAAGVASFLLDNRSRDYSPENTSSPLAGNIRPARPVRIRATFNSNTYTLFRGHLDDFEVLPGLEERSVKVTCMDGLAKVQEARVSTQLYNSIRTGDAIGHILDAIGWPTDNRDLDSGATIMPWWWAEGEASEELQKLVSSEGPPSFAFIDENNNFVFRDRHHRLTRAAALTSQATFSGTAEPAFSAPLSYDHGWRDIVNSVTFSVPIRQAPDLTVDRGAMEAVDGSGEFFTHLSEVWTSSNSYVLSAGEIVEVEAESSEPFYDAEVPVEGRDFVETSGGLESVWLSRTSGVSLSIFLKAAVSNTVVTDLRLRARPIPVTTTLQVTLTDSESIAQYGVRSGTVEAPWAGLCDARAIGNLVLAQRAERLPIVSMRVVHDGNTSRLTQQLSRDLSDRVTVVESETGLNDDFYIERITHTIGDGGLFHETVFGLEKARDQVANAFTFDTAGKGFNGGVFGAGGISDPDNVLRFDTTGQGFDQGLFGF